MKKIFTIVSMLVMCLNMGACEVKDGERNSKRNSNSDNYTSDESISNSYYEDAFEEADGFTKEEIQQYSCIMCGAVADHVIEGIGSENGGYDYEFLCDDCWDKENELYHDCLDDIEKNK